MRARDLVKPYTSVSVDSDAIEAVRLLVQQRLPGLLVIDRGAHPHAIVPADQLVGALVPAYVQEDRGLAHVIDEPHADHLGRALLGRQVADCLPLGTPFLPIAGPDSTAMEIAELMEHTHSPLVAVVERPRHGTRRLLGVVTATYLLDRLLQAA
jgi:CBS domain-containing protein